MNLSNLPRLGNSPDRVVSKRTVGATIRDQHRAATPMVKCAGEPSGFDTSLKLAQDVNWYAPWAFFRMLWRTGRSVAGRNRKCVATPQGERFRTLLRIAAYLWEVINPPPFTKASIQVA